MLKAKGLGIVEIYDAQQLGNSSRIGVDTGGFDFGAVDPYLGPEARRYLLAWDDFNKTTTEGLTRK